MSGIDLKFQIELSFERLDGFGFIGDDWLICEDSGMIFLAFNH